MPGWSSVQSRTIVEEVDLLAEAVEECSVIVTRVVPDIRGRPPELGLRIRKLWRAGNHGERPVRHISVREGERLTAEGDDFFGRHVILAARVAASALGGEILVSGVFRELVSGQAFRFEDRGERAMKGFSEPVRVWLVR